MLQQIFTTEGRLNRAPYIKYSIILLIISFFAVFATSFIAILLTGDASGILGNILAAAVSLPCYAGSIMLSIRRLHDLNRTGWLALLMIIPVVNVLLSIYLVIFRGTVGYNDYGADPL